MSKKEFHKSDFDKGVLQVLTLIKEFHKSDIDKGALQV